MDLSFIQEILFESGLFEAIVWIMVFVLIIKVIMLLPKALEDLDL